MANKNVMDHLDRAVQNYWHLRAESYSLSTCDELSDTHDNPYATLLRQWLKPCVPNQKALDIGCGPGFLAIQLAKLGFITTGVDSCESMLAMAQKNARPLNIRFVLADAMNASFENEIFDVIASRNLVWNLPDPEAAYRTWFNWLKPGGKLIIFDGNHYRYLTDSNRHDRPHRQTHKYLGDIDIGIMESIAKQLPMTNEDRPDYDQILLKKAGFVNIDTIVLSRTSEKIRDFAIICEKNHAD